MTTDGSTHTEVTEYVSVDPVAELMEASRYGRCFYVERISFVAPNKQTFRCLVGRLRFRCKHDCIKVFMEKPLMKQITLVYPFDIQVGHVVFENPSADGATEIAVYTGIDRALIQRLR